MDELKLIFASNLIRLRTAAGMTQAELGEQLNYSDKSISKWERGEGLPDVYILAQIASRSITCSTSTMRGSPDPSPPRATAAIMPSSLSPSWAS